MFTGAERMAASSNFNHNMFENGKFPIPDGFQDVLSSLAKEVLRHQPPDIYRFCGLFFDTLLEMRDGNFLLWPNSSPAQVYGR